MTMVEMRYDGKKVQKQRRSASMKAYRPVDKDMPQPRLIKLNRTNGSENYLSYDVVFIALACFLNRLYQSLK
jgi:hypothetical protein